MSDQNSLLETNRVYHGQHIHDKRLQNYLKKLMKTVSILILFDDFDMGWFQY